MLSRNFASETLPSGAKGVVTAGNIPLKSMQLFSRFKLKAIVLRTQESRKTPSWGGLRPGATTVPGAGGGCQAPVRSVVAYRLRVKNGAKALITATRKASRRVISPPVRTPHAP